VSVALLPEVGPEAAGFDARGLARCRYALETEVAAGRLPGALLVVARDGRVAFTVQVGVLDPGRDAPMPADAIFRIFSMTKPLTSVAALILMEDGRLQLADPVEAYLPDFRPPGVATAAREGPARSWRLDAARPITLHDLLTHSSGLVYGERSSNTMVREAQHRLGLGVNPRGLAPDDFVARLAQAPLAHPPGSTWAYGPSTDLLGIVIERIAGVGLEAFLSERVFRPLGMHDTGFSVAPCRAARLAQPFGCDPMSGEPISEPGQVFDARVAPAMASGGAGALSTASDYLRFAQMLLQGGTLGGERVMSPAAVRLMTTDHLGSRIAVPVTPGEAAMNTPGYGFGLGVAVRLPDGLASVPGSSGDFFWSGTAGTSFWVDPRERLAVVFMAQAPGAVRIGHRRLIRQMVYEALID
jgi:CubicO group peptidase (beta-lactamase class C family)